MNYLLQVLRHKWFVCVAGIRVGGLPFWRLLIHDWSKFTPTEFVAYRKRFEFGGCPPEEWKAAWLHHIHSNPHHWQHWLLDGKPIVMPHTYVREMVADILGAGRSYTGSWDIQPWLDTEFPKMKFHPESARYFRQVLKELGFRIALL